MTHELAVQHKVHVPDGCAEGFRRKAEQLSALLLQAEDLFRELADWDLDGDLAEAEDSVQMAVADVQSTLDAVIVEQDDSDDEEESDFDVAWEINKELH